MKRTCERNGGADEIFNASYDGLFLFIDEADNSHRDLQLGVFCKQLTERLHRAGCDKVVVALAGLPTLWSVLNLSHRSAIRLFSADYLEPTERR